MKERTLALLSLAAFFAFLVIAVAVKLDPSLGRSELQVTLWANHLQLGEPLNSLLVGASLYGREYFWIALVGIMLLFGDRRTKLVALGLCAVFVVGIAAGEVAKAVIARPRPYLLAQQQASSGAPIVRIPFDTDYSFPSGHALIVSIGAVYSLLTFRKKWVAGLLLVEALVVCFSRLYVFAHFPTDVIAGFALGSAIALAGRAVERRYLVKFGDQAADFVVKLLRDGPLKL
ncbi:MAG: phosphatase PAP2 family protein [Nitrososphaerota archaeon]|nr:phosphatase PAP2 family protein [Nitrososphaerota archaeon]MDG7023208.1 phosphatase PAP2 family protein [Nitrososphaerota archaeon]